MLSDKAPIVAERLTWSEVCARYPSEWVVAVEMEENEHSYDPFKTAHVIAHHCRRSDASAAVKAAFQTHDDVGSFWTGRRTIWPGTYTARLHR